MLAVKMLALAIEFSKTGPESATEVASAKSVGLAARLRLLVPRLRHLDSRAGINPHSLKAAQSDQSVGGVRNLVTTFVRVVQNTRRRAECGGFPKWRPIGPNLLNSQCFMWITPTLLERMSNKASVMCAPERR
jgi:hypothetical protein